MAKRYSLVDLCNHHKLAYELLTRIYYYKRRKNQGIITQYNLISDIRRLLHEIILLNMWKVLSVLILTTCGLNGLPISQDAELGDEQPTLATELLPPKIDAEERNFGVDIFNENVTLATELQPPSEDLRGKLGVVYIINLFAVRNSSGEDAEEVLNTDVVKKIPGILEPLATVLLILEDDDENTPVSLDEFAKDLEEEGFKVEKIGEDKETEVIKVDMDGTEDPDVELIKPGKLNKIRRRRSPEPHAHLISKLLDKFGHNGGGGCDVCQGGGNRGYPSGGQTVGVIPIYVVPSGGGEQQHYQQQPQPQYYQPQPQYYQPPPQQYHPQPQPSYPQPCNVCGGGGGGNHGSHSQSSAQASAQSSSNSW